MTMSAENNSSANISGSSCRVGGKSSGVLSPRTEDASVPGSLEGNNSQSNRRNSNCGGGNSSPFISTSSLWSNDALAASTIMLAASSSIESITNSHPANSISTNGSCSSDSTPASLWETPRRSSIGNWRCVGSSMGMLQEESSEFSSLKSTANSFVLETNTPSATPRLRSSSMVGPSFASIAMKGGKLLEAEEAETERELDSLQVSPDHKSSKMTDNTGSLPVDVRLQQFMQLPASLHEEIGIENAEEAAEIFKRSSMDNLLDFDPITIFGGLAPDVGNDDDPLAGSTLMSSVNPSDFRRHSINWLGSSTGNSGGTAPGNNAGHSGGTGSAGGAGKGFFFGSTLISSIPEFYPSNHSQSNSNSNSQSSSRSSSPVIPDAPFSDDFVFGSTTTTSSNSAAANAAQFSKKRFTRRHSIAADGVLSGLEDSFAQSLSFGGNSNIGHINNIANANSSSSFGSFNSLESHPATDYLFNGNVYAAYAALLTPSPPSASTDHQSQDGYYPLPPMDILSAMKGHHSQQLTSAAAAFIPASSLSPAQAGIPPTMLSYPNAAFHVSTHRGPLYLVEFKTGRTELFFVVDLDTIVGDVVKLGDLVIVEADRGEDLGRIVGEIPMPKLKQLISQVPDAAPASASIANSNYNNSNSNAVGNGSYDDYNNGNNNNAGHNLAGLKEVEIAALLSGKEIVPKRIHRLATSLDVRFLQTKAQEEALAIVRCQSRIRQKKLPMDVVDAEYQWDRNKLTFYFAADRRIDFRELVRDLFRIYKTRIWMCAVDKNRASILNSLAAAYNNSL